MFTERDITDILLDHADDGYSVNVYNDIPTTGYMVGGWVPSLKLGQDTLRPYNTTDGYLASHWDRLTSDSNYFAGVWTDSDTGVIYIDISRNLADLPEALAVAANFGEIAIWDVEAGKEIRLQD